MRITSPFYYSINTPGYLLCFLLTILISHRGVSQSLTVNIYNNTGYTLDSLTIGNTNVGTLENKKSTGPLFYKEFHMDSGLADEPLFARIGNERIFSNNFSFCGTEKSVLKEGDLRYAIELRRTDSLTILVYGCVPK